jgi:hypothetical protein
MRVEVGPVEYVIDIKTEVEESGRIVAANSYSETHPRYAWAETEIGSPVQTLL